MAYCLREETHTHSHTYTRYVCFLLPQRLLWHFNQFVRLRVSLMDRNGHNMLLVCQSWLQIPLWISASVSSVSVPSLSSYHILLYCNRLTTHITVYVWFHISFMLILCSYCTLRALTVWRTSVDAGLYYTVIIFNWMTEWWTESLFLSLPRVLGAEVC